MSLSASKAESLAHDLEQKKHNDLYRQRLLLDVSRPAYVNCAGKSILNLASNDYLGLGRHPKVIEAIQSAAENFGAGSGASQLLSGYSGIHQELEARLAELLGFEKVVLFGSSYLANLGWQQALCNKHSVVFHDRLNHASLLDGTVMSGAKLLRFPHKDMQQLQRLLEKNSSIKDKCIVTDSVFSMDGDIADINSMTELSAQHEAMFVVDDAHGFGVLGNKGAGVFDDVESASVKSDLYIGGLGKAIAAYGGFVAGSTLLVESIIQSARSMHYSTSLPPSIVAASIAALDVIEKESCHRHALMALISWFRSKTQEMGIEFLPSNTPIQSLVVGDKNQALSIAEQMRADGFFVMAIRPPTVPENTARIRVSLRADHTQSELQAFLQSLLKVLKHHE